MAAAPTFYIVPGSTVKSVIEAHRSQVFEAVKAAYHFHASGDSINPDSYFLRYPDKPDARIIALPAHLGGVAATRFFNQPQTRVTSDAGRQPAVVNKSRCPVLLTSDVSGFMQPSS